MLQLTLELLPFVVFVAVGVFAFRNPAPLRSQSTLDFPRRRTFCRFSEGEALMLADPDGKPVPRGR